MKRFFLIVSFLTIFFLIPSPIFAQNSSTKQKDSWYQFKQHIINWFSKTFNEDEATASSNRQLNNGLRTLIPASNQGDDLPLNSSNTAITTDNDKQEKTFFLQIIPASGQSNLESTNSGHQLYQNFNNWLSPNSWQKNP